MTGIHLHLYSPSTQRINNSDLSSDIVSTGKAEDTIQVACPEPASAIAMLINSFIQLLWIFGWVDNKRKSSLYSIPEKKGHIE
jgi:hypothetical protein